ncbi:MAG TPA: 2-keto-4-pentenoate hydratase [Eubacteriaceae bacterium]|nr:2-keto-4-pentenoate hydratase [Eubacteriaceae bacterium]
MLEKQIIKNLANELYTAQKTCTPIEAITDRYPQITIEEAYEVQLEVLKLKEADGIHVIGKKIGLTNKAIRDQIGVQEPDYGIITSEGLLLDGDFLYMDNFIAPRIETEIAFILSKDITKDIYPVKPTDIIEATYGIAPALEIVDSRVKDWKIKIQDTVSDAASYGAVVLGNRITKLKGLDLRLIGMAAYLNGELVQNGSSAAVMGNPINSMVWLANKLLNLGMEMKKGEIIISGSLTPVFDIKAGDTVNVIFDHLGSVSLAIR